MSYLTSRAYYKARILLVPMGPSGAALTTSMSDAGLRQVRIATPAGDPEGILTWEIGTTEADVSTETIGDLVASTDMMVFLGSGLEEIPHVFVEAMAIAGRGQGTLLAGVLVGVSGWESESGAASIVVLRRELDMLVTVKKVDLARDFIEALKGGTQEATPGKLFQHLTTGA